MPGHWGLGAGGSVVRPIKGCRALLQEVELLLGFRLSGFEP